MNKLKFIKTYEFENLLLIGGTHGDEVSGHHAINSFDFTKYKKMITAINNINEYGIKNNKRNDENNIDINRMYGLSDKKIHTNIKEKIRFIESQVLKADFVIDFHEAKSGIRSVDKKGIGNTIITQNSHKLANKIVNNINTKLNKKQKFMIYCKKKKINHSLRDFCNKNNKRYILVEISKIINHNDRITIARNIIKTCIDFIKKLSKIN